MSPRAKSRDNSMASPTASEPWPPRVVSSGSKLSASPAGDAEAKRSPDAEQPSPTAAAPEATVASNRTPAKKLALIGAVAVAAVVGSWYGYHYLTVGRYIVSTDDAYVGSYMSNISPKVAANVAEVPVVDNQTVKAGDVLVRLDDGDYKLAADQAAAKVATQRTVIATFDAQIGAARATADQARAQLDAAKAALEKAEADFNRTNILAQRDYSSKASLDAARAARDSAKAQVTAQQAAIVAADANIAVLAAQKTQSEHSLKELEIAQAKADRDLAFTVVRAPFDGVVGNRSVQVGDYVTAGKRLAAVVPLDKVFIDANLKETQLANIRPGERVKVKVDAFDGAAVEGVVKSIAPASGSQFSLLPPDNATGNFTKIVQRVPVRIEVAASQSQGRLRPGLSVVVDIDTRTAPPQANAVAAK